VCLQCKQSFPWIQVKQQSDTEFTHKYTHLIKCKEKNLINWGNRVSPKRRVHIFITTDLHLGPHTSYHKNDTPTESLIN
jgi:hypothetical protein